MKDIICFDIGTTNLKTVYRINNEYFTRTYDKREPEGIMEYYLSKNEYNKILLTGTGSRLITKQRDFIFLQELEASANIIRVCGLVRGIVVNMGTGTSFLKYDKEKTTHLIGTGVGGGTLLGLARRLLGITSSVELEQLAQNGKLSEINLTAKDIFENEVSWLQNDVTISNFGNKSEDEANIAIGICSLVAEPIMSILKAHIDGTNIKDIVFCGGTSKNSIIRNIIEKYSELFGLNCLFLKYPDYGTCFGAISLYDGTIYPNIIDKTIL